MPFSFSLFRNFVPGSFLDSDGNTALINPPAVTDILDDFLSRVEQHKSEFGAIAAVLIINVASQMINIIGLIVRKLFILFYSLPK